MKKYTSKKLHVKVARHYVDTVVIGTIDEKGNFKLHPFSEFIRETYREGYSTNTMNNAASAVCNYLNWYLQLKKPLSEMTEDDLESYLTEHAYSNKMKRSSLNLRKDYIKQFIYYLAKKGMINVDPKSMETEKAYRGRRILQTSARISAPLTEFKPEAVNKIKTIEPEYFYEFLNTAITTAPCIALGILLSFTGGLRSGEVVNLDKSSYTLIGNAGADGFILDVRKRDLRTDCEVGNVKRQRMQKTIPVGKIATQILDMHLDRYTSPDNRALFIDAQGNAMTTQTYANYFNTVKKAFIKRLKESDDLATINYGLQLESKPWSTHIGRGFFSNTIVNVCNNNPGLLAACRGDRDPRSAIVYLDDEAIEAASKVLTRWYQEV